MAFPLLEFHGITLGQITPVHQGTRPMFISISGESQKIPGLPEIEKHVGRILGIEELYSVQSPPAGDQ